MIFHGFKLHFPNANVIEHLFMYLFAIRISSLVKCLCKSFAYFLIGLLLFLLLSFEDSLDTDILSDMRFASVFSHLKLVSSVLLELSLKYSLLCSRYLSIT